MTSTTVTEPSHEVDCKKVQGRRALGFKSLDEALADAEALVAAQNVRMLGNHTLGQLLAHLGIAIHSSIDGFSGQAPWLIRMVARTLKGRILTKGMRPGFRLPTARESGAFPTVASTAEGLEKYRAAVARCAKEQMTARHPAFGKLTHEEWYRLHCHHAGLHLSFCVVE
jgi:hypothetical protein